MWALKWGAKFGPRFGVRRIVFSFRGPQNGVQILGPSLGSTLPVFFPPWRPKRSSPSRMLVSRFVCFTSTLQELGRTLLRALVFGTLFWPHFGVPRQWFYPRERGCCRDQGWRCDFGSRFSWSFGCCISCCLGFFRALSWLQFRAWTRVGFLRGRLVVFFCCCFGWTFRCCLGRCFSLCFCVVGCLAPGLDPCMVVLVPVSQKFWLLFSTFDET